MKLRHKSVRAALVYGVARAVWLTAMIYAGSVALDLPWINTGVQQGTVITQEAP